MSRSVRRRRELGAHLGVGQGGGAELDIRPAAGLQAQPASPLVVPPGAVRSVLVSVVLGDHMRGPPQEVWSSHPVAISVVDIDIEFRLRQPQPRKTSRA